MRAEPVQKGESKFHAAAFVADLGAVALGGEAKGEQLAKVQFGGSGDLEVFHWRWLTKRLTLHLGAGFKLNGEMKSLDGNGAHLTIGQTARLAKIGIPTMRFYERAGLLPKPTRSASIYRLYPDEVVARVRFIRRAQQLGFSLKEIKSLLTLRAGRRTSCAEVRARAHAKIADIESRIRSLRQMSRALAALAEECDNSKGIECPLLKHLESAFER